MKDFKIKVAQEANYLKPLLDELAKSSDLKKYDLQKTAEEVILKAHILSNQYNGLFNAKYSEGVFRKAARIVILTPCSCELPF